MGFPIPPLSDSEAQGIHHVIDGAAPFAEGLVIITTKCVERLAFPVVIVGRAVLAGLVIIIVVTNHTFFVLMFVINFFLYAGKAER